MVNIKGFHGTLDEKANKILNSKFIHSSKNSEWLGSGVYFFVERKDAEWWAKLEAGKPQNKYSVPTVLSANIVTDDEFFYDLDLQRNMDKMRKEARAWLQNPNLGFRADLSREQLRCLVCNLYARKHGIKVFTFTFPAITTNEIGFTYSKMQRQICVNDDSCIRNLRKCYKGGI